MSNLRYYAVYTTPPRVNRVSPPFMLVQQAFLCAFMHSSCRALQSPRCINISFYAWEQLVKWQFVGVGWRAVAEALITSYFIFHISYF